MLAADTRAPKAVASSRGSESQVRKWWSTASSTHRTGWSTLIKEHAEPKAVERIHLLEGQVIKAIVSSRQCSIEDCGKWSSFGVVCRKTRAYWAQHAPDLYASRLQEKCPSVWSDRHGNVGELSKARAVRRCRDKKKAEYCAKHAIK